MTISTRALSGRILRPLITAAAVLIFAAAIFGACKQGEGDRCQVNSDCEEGLTCCVLLENRIEGGSCRTAANCELVGDTGPDVTPREAGAETTPREQGAETATDKGAGDSTVDSPAGDSTVDTTSPDQGVDAAQDASAG